MGRDVATGMRFKKPDAAVASVWEVVGLLKRHAGRLHDHAVLVCERDPTTLKVVSLSALCDRRLFQRAE